MVRQRTCIAEFGLSSVNLVQLEPAFLLHSRAYRNTSMIVDLFCLHHGWISAVAKGVKSTKSSMRNNLQAFQPLLISWYGRNELVTLTQAEIDTPFPSIKADYLAWGFYLNELLYRLLGKHDPQPQLFADYQNILLALCNETASEKHLRYFECNLLANLGYGLQLATETNTRCPLEPDTDYHYSFDHGPRRQEIKSSNPLNIFKGSSLLALHERRLDDTQILSDAKRLLRGAIHSLLGDRPLRSRELFRTRNVSG